MTSQGRPITFTISPDEKLTAISVGYNFNGCSGTQTYSNLDIDIKPQIECIPAPCPLPLSSYRSVDYESGHPFQGQSTGIRGFVSDALGLYTGEGVVYFRNYPGCGNAQTGWNVNRLN